MARLEEFVTNIAKSGLVAPAELDRTLAEFSREPAVDAAVRFARVLIERGRLTPYQSRKLLAGATRGFILGGHRILRPLGEGGMGKVFLGINESTNERVAIKVLPPRKAAEEEQALARFLREMDLSRRATHPNLARTLEVGQADGVHYMILEYIPGESLYHAIKGKGGGPLRVTDVARLFSKVLDGLQAAHDAGLVHRDIKPSNIMITPEGDVRLLDLGLARAMGDESSLTRTNLVVGTLDYASPEQLVNASSADARSDLYSVGCTIYFTLAGRPPFEGGDIVNKIFKQRMEDPQPLENVSRGVPAAFGAIVRKLMAKDPRDRYQTAMELRADLARWTDPERVRSILGAEAETARVFRPAPPEIDDDDLRLVPDDGRGPLSFTLRDLGAAEPAAAPVRRPVPIPMPAIIVPHGERFDELADEDTASPNDDSRWLTQFIAVAVVLGLLAILAIALFV